MGGGPVTPFGIESWILHEIMIEPLGLRELYSIAKVKGLSATLDEIVCAVHMMIDEDLVTIDNGKVTALRMPCAELRQDIRDTEIVLKEAIRKGGLTVRQVRRCEALLKAIDGFYEDESEEASE